jgi:SAM-dependent methyltransferase
MTTEAIEGYRQAAPELIDRYEALAADVVLEPVLHLFPKTPCRVLDVGAGTGRNPAWFALQGHRVTACEPVEAFREAGKHRHPDQDVRWVDDALPHLDAVKSLADSFDLVLLSAVWQHVDLPDRQLAMDSLRSLMAPDGTLIMSVRHGPGAPGRPVYEAADAETEALADGCGLKLVFRRQTESIQAANKAAGVTWSWMAFAAR